MGKLSDKVKSATISISPAFIEEDTEVAPGIRYVREDPDDTVVLAGSTDAIARFLLTQTYGDPNAAVALAFDCVIGVAATQGVVEAIAGLDP